MREIGLRANVSVSTVSLALSNSPLVAKRTREKVREAALQLGYRPNPLVSALMRTRRKQLNPELQPTLAMITCHPTRFGWKTASPILRDFGEGIEARVKALGYRIETFWRGEPAMTDERLSDILVARGIKGVLVFPFADPNSRFRLDWSEFATVTMGFSIRGMKHDRVASDHHQCVRLAVKRCYERGYRRMALTDLQHMMDRVDDRWSGAYLSTLRLYPDAGEPLLYHPTEWRDNELWEWFQRAKPDLIITSAPKFFKSWAESHGLRIPEDLGLVSLNVPSLDDTQSGICQNPDLQAKTAVDLLVRRLVHHEFGEPRVPTNSLIEGNWVEGETVRGTLRP
jgi:DNA-binding LacI/PurR family transcriptional regulator